MQFMINPRTPRSVLDIATLAIPTLKEITMKLSRRQFFKYGVALGASAGIGIALIHPVLRQRRALVRTLHV